MLMTTGDRPTPSTSLALSPTKFYLIFAIFYVSLKNIVIIIKRQAQEDAGEIKGMKNGGEQTAKFISSLSSPSDHCHAEPLVLVPDQVRDDPGSFSISLSKRSRNNPRSEPRTRFGMTVGGMTHREIILQLSSNSISISAPQGFL